VPPVASSFSKLPVRLKLPQSAGEPVAFFMYPQAETAGSRRDSLDPDSFRYTMTARELNV